MADENEEVKDKAEEGKEKKQEKGDKKKGKEKAKKGSAKKSSLLAWVLIALIVTVCSAGGGIAANIFFAPSSAQAEAVDKETLDDDIFGEDGGETKIQKEFTYYEFEPLTVNLDVKRQNRYIKVTIVLALIDKENTKITELLDNKKAELKNWLMTYMAGLSLEEVAGRKNIVRIQREIADALNDQLWPNQKIHINHVLFKDFAVQ